jgi:hypothetical protein
MKKILILLVILIALITIYGTFFTESEQTQRSSSLTKPVVELPENTMANLSLSSPVFLHDKSIPAKYTCEGDDINPPLTISDVPEGTESLVLILDDPDAVGGVWDHWLLWNIDPETSQVPENSVPETAVQGTTSWGKQEYGGPCPPPGSGTHHYTFKLYALDTTLDLPGTSTKSEVEEVIGEHILKETTLVGLYERE